MSGSSAAIIACATTGVLGRGPRLAMHLNVFASAGSPLMM
jgi:hypothetical protein